MESREILVVEDEGIVAADIEECLTGLGYKVLAVAPSGEEAIRLAEELDPNLVLMDIRLQGEIDGIAAAAYMRDRLQTPVVYLTAHADPATFERAKITEPYGYVLKPFKEMELRTAIELAMYRHDQETKSDKPAPAAASPTAGAQPNGKAEPLSEQAQEAKKYLKLIEPFQYLDDATITTLANSCKFSQFKSGDFIALEGDADVSGFVVVEGRVAMLKTSVTGKDLIVELLPPGDPFGLLATIDQGPYPVTVRAQVESRVMWIPRAQLLQVLDKYPDLGKTFIQGVFDRLRNAHDISRALAHDRVEVRISSALCALVPRFCAKENGSTRLQINMTRQELAELTGATTETAIRVTKAMEREGILDLTQSGVIRILNLEALKDIAEQ